MGRKKQKTQHELLLKYLEKKLLRVSVRGVSFLHLYLFLSTEEPHFLEASKKAEGPFIHLFYTVSGLREKFRLQFSMKELWMMTYMCKLLWG